MTLSTLVLDFGNVVGFFSHRRAAEQLLAHAEAPAPPVEELEAALFHGELARAYDTGRIPTREFIDTVRSTFRIGCDEDTFGRAFSDIFEPNGEVCGLLPLLKRRCRLVLLSNTNDLHARHFQDRFAAHFAPFDALVFSHEVGALKPDPAIYAACQRRAGVPASEIFFVDDLADNVAAARRLGWQGLCYRPGEGLRERLAGLGLLDT